MTRPGSVQRLRIGLAVQLHRLPEEIDSMLWEDVLRLAMHNRLESEELERIRKQKPGKGGAKTARTVYKPRQKRPKG